MSSRFVRPETVRVEISQGDWLLIKKQLTAGEQREIFARMIKPMHASVSGAATPNGGGDHLEIDTLQTGLSQVLAYLVDWSLVDGDGKPVVIRHQPIDVVTAHLNALELDSFTEILTAIQTHDAAMKGERDRARAVPFGEVASSPTSPPVA